MDKKVSVIVNCHNGQKYLSECIISILNQKYQNFEIIFYDNFSDDKSKEKPSKPSDNKTKTASGDKSKPANKETKKK